jgi:predicted RNase H-like HicB family nuclease
MNYKYTIKVFWHKVDECYYAVIPNIKEFEHISAWGDSPEEAVKQLQTPIEMVIEHLREKGKKIPEPTFEKVS